MDVFLAGELEPAHRRGRNAAANGSLKVKLEVIIIT